MATKYRRVRLGTYMGRFSQINKKKKFWTESNVGRQGTWKISIDSQTNTSKVLFHVTNNKFVPLVLKV